MVTTNDDDLAEHVRMLRVHGSRRKYHHEELGLNSRLDALQAAILRVKLKHVDAWIERKRALATEYDKELSDINWLEVPYVMSECRHTYHQYTIKVSAERRASIQEVLAHAGIQTQVYYPEPLHQQLCFVSKQELPEEPPNVDWVVPSVLSLPMSSGLRGSDMETVVQALKEAGDEAVR
jgi:dTDP-4-amino-4,6-dideoxygalactose transaminase